MPRGYRKRKPSGFRPSHEAEWVHEETGAIVEIVGPTVFTSDTYSVQVKKPPFHRESVAAELSSKTAAKEKAMAWMERHPDGPDFL